MKNTIYRFNKWLDKSPYTLLYLIVPILLANLFTFLFTDFILIGLSIWGILLLFTFFRIRIHNKKITFDLSKYEPPHKGDKLIIKIKFFWNGTFYKYPPPTTHGNKPWYYTINPNEEWDVLDVKELDDDWMIYLEDGDGDKMHIKYLQTKKYWETKSDIRNNKLKKLGI